MVIALVDDRTEDRNRLKAVLDEYAVRNGRRFEICSFDSGEALMKGFQAHRYQVIFLDVFMEDNMTGIEAAERIRALDEDALLIFLTTSREHQSEAIHWHVFDYLNKEPELLEHQIFQVMDRIFRISSDKNIPCLTFASEKESVCLPYNRLKYLMSDRNYLIIYDNQGKQYRTRATFSSVWETLRKDDRFLQIIRGVIVNMEYLTDLSAGVCVLKGDIHLPMNVRNSASIEQTWTNYTFARIRRESLEGRDAE